MIWNNLKALGIHLSILGVLIGIPFLGTVIIGLRGWIFFLGLIEYAVPMRYVGITLESFIGILYFGVASRILTNQGNRIRNLLSVISVSAIGLVLWSLSIVIQSNFYAFLSWKAYDFWHQNSYYMAARAMGWPPNFYYSLPFSFIPTLLMWLGLEYKARKTKKEFDLENYIINIKEEQ